MHLSINNSALKKVDHTLEPLAADDDRHVAGHRVEVVAGRVAQLGELGVVVPEADDQVGNIGTEQQMNYTAIGSSVNLASRLQSAAAPGQILLSPAAYGRVRAHVEVHELPPMAVKGFSEPITVYELLGLK